MSEPRAQEWPELESCGSDSALTIDKLNAAVATILRGPVLRELRARHAELCALKLYAAPLPADDLECRFLGVPLYEDGSVLPGYVEARFSDGSRKLICVARGEKEASSAD